MTDETRSASTTADTAIGRFRSAFRDALRGVTGKEIAWVLAIGFVFMVTRAYSLAGAGGRSWPVPIRLYEWFYPLQWLVYLFAFRVAEHPRLAASPGWKRYAVAIPAAALLNWLLGTPIVLSAGEVHAFPGRVAGPFWASVDGVVLGIVAAIVYSSVMRSRRAQAAFDAAALERAAGRRRVTAARLATLQAQVDPALLFSTLDLVERLYEHDTDAAERTLAELIDFLRTALPKIGVEGSTLGRELHLARAYLAIVNARMGSRLDTRIEVRGEILGASFPALILVPLVERALRYGLEPLPHGGRIAIEAARRGDRLELTVTHNGAGDPDGTWLEPLRERLMGLYGEAARLTLTTGAAETRATVDLPHEAAPTVPDVPATPAMESVQ
jgi:hypothetical protein